MQDAYHEAQPIKTTHEKRTEPIEPSFSTTFISLGIWGRRVANVQFGALCDGVLRRVSCLERLAGHNPVDLCRSC